MGRKNFLYASTPELIKCAGEANIEWVVVSSYGHGGNAVGSLRDDVPALLTCLPDVAAKRKPFEKDIRRMHDEINTNIELAHKYGMKAVLHSYELNMPKEFIELHPEYFAQQASEVREADPRSEVDRYLCPLDERVQKLTEEKTAEIIAALPGLDAYVFSYHESQITMISHRCDACKDRPYLDLLVPTYDAIRRGIDRVNPDIKLIYRMWGTQNTEERYYRRYVEVCTVEGFDESKWYTPRLDVYKKMHFKPEEYNRDIDARLEGKNAMLCYKATAGDYTLNQPLNRFLGTYKTPSILELSYEHCVYGARIPLIISKQHQLMAKAAREKGVEHLCGVPVNWGNKKGIAQNAARLDGFYPDTWSLNKINMDMCLKLMDDPDIDLKAEITAWLKERNSGKDAGRLADMLLLTPDIMEKAVNVNGVSTVMNTNSSLSPPAFDLSFTVGETWWYGPFFSDGEKRIEPTAENIEKIRSDRKEAEQRAQEVLAEVKGMELSADTKKEAQEYFSRFLDAVRMLGVSRERLWCMWRVSKVALDDKQRARLVMRISNLIQEEEKLLCNSEYLAQMYRSKKSIQI